jgi:formate hydrogenlyase transcriptional activator
VAPKALRRNVDSCRDFRSCLGEFLMLTKANAILDCMSGQKILTYDLETTIEHYQTLLEVSEAIASHQDVSALFHDLAKRLHRVVHFDYLSLVLYNPEHKTTRLVFLEPLESEVSPGSELPIEESPVGLVLETQRGLILSDDEAEIRYPKVFQKWCQFGVKSVCLLRK